MWDLFVQGLYSGFVWFVASVAFLGYWTLFLVVFALARQWVHGKLVKRNNRAKKDSPNPGLH